MTNVQILRKSATCNSEVLEHLNNIESPNLANCLTLRVPDEGYSRNMSCTLYKISTCLFSTLTFGIVNDKLYHIKLYHATGIF